MGVYGADGRRIGTVERVDDGALFAGERRIGNDAIERVEAGNVYLFGASGTYIGTETADEKAQRSRGLPHTDERLFVNEREVERSLEERLPRDGQR
jgi:hypothetical protein